MKRGVFAVTMTVMVVGVASALAFAPAAQPVSQSTPRPAAAEAAAPVVAQLAQAKPTLEARQAPVPLLMKPRTPVELPTATATDGAAAPPPQQAATAGGENSAKAAIEADGYKGVKVLRKAADGRWYAEAMRGNTKVLLTVDADGSVAAE